MFQTWYEPQRNQETGEMVWVESTKGNDNYFKTEDNNKYVMAQLYTLYIAKPIRDSQNNLTATSFKIIQRNNPFFSDLKKHMNAQVTEDHLKAITDIVQLTRKLKAKQSARREKHNKLESNEEVKQTEPTVR